MHMLSICGVLHLLEVLRVFVCFQVTFEENVTQVDHADRFSSALINVSLSDTSAKNIRDRLYQCSGTVALVWRVENFAETVSQLFPASEEWRFWDDTQKGNANRRSDLSTEQTLLLLPCFVLVSVGDAFKKFSPLLQQNCQ